MQIEKRWKHYRLPGTGRGFVSDKTITEEGELTGSPLHFKHVIMKKLIVVWLDGAITPIQDLAEVSPASIANGNITAIIDVTSSRYLNLDNGDAEEWVDLPTVKETSVEAYAD